ncbi:ABC transporter permease [Neobacillus soli]|uniref:ABC transporter permease n=1 Tax=Neobacillus soli TaxID=220688 RepID=UPI0008257CEC|nr:ABC transporter permease [Neobacillus soli]
MSQWMTLLQKEMLEMWRNFKWIWVPITFILLGVKEPITSYYMPQILDAVGGLPEGAVINIPTPTAAEVLISGLSQYTTLGVLIIVLTTMGIIAAERKSGVAAMILVKPVSFHSFVTAKWAGSMILMWLSFFIGYLSTWYYTGLLFEWIPFSEFFQSFFFYALWLTVILTVTVFFSASLMAPGMSGFISLAVAIIISLVSSTLSNWLEWSPAQLTTYANEILMDKEIPDSTLPASLLAAVCIILLLYFSVFIFRKKELAA